MFRNPAKGHATLQARINRGGHLATLAGFEPAISTLNGFLGEVPARHL